MIEKQYFRECNCDIPETRDDIEKIPTFLHVEESEIFQLIHNDLGGAGTCEFQVYGRFKGIKVIVPNDEEKFLLQKIDLKLVNTVLKEGRNFYKITNANIERSEGSNIIKINIKVYPESYNPPEVIPIKGISDTLDTLELLDRYQIIESNVTINGESTRNGIPCKNATFF